MTYNGRNQVIQEQYPPTDGGTNPSFKTYDYDSYGNCIAITDEMGHISRYYYDSYRRCVTYTESINAPDANGNNVSLRRWDWFYDRYIPGLGLKPASAHTSKTWRVQVEPAYNQLGDRPMTHRAHDVNDRIVLEESGWIQPASQPLGNWQPGPQVQTSYFTYDKNGQKSTYTDPRGRRTRYEYNGRNRLWKTHETENTIERITETQYDPRGNKTLVKFPDNSTQKWEEYDSFGQAWRFVDERDNKTNLQYIWGPMKKLYVVTTHRLKDDGGWEDQPTYFSYDLMGKPTRIDFPDSTFEKTEYHDLQVWRWTARNGETKTFGYDARGREISHDWSDPATPDVGRTWDPANRLTSIWNSVATISFGYDDAAQVLWESELVAGAGGWAPITYRRYGNGTPSQIWYPNGMWVARAYTPQGQLQSVWDNGPYAWRSVINYFYHPDGKVERGEYGNSTISAYNYDGRGMISFVHHTRSSPSNQNLSYRDYYRDSRDRIYAWKKSTENSVNPMEDGRGDRYEYDPEGQLTRAVYGAPNPANSFDGFQSEDRFYGSWNGNWLGYDALGNRQGWNWQLASGWTYYDRRANKLNQYLTWSPSAVFYDDNHPSPWYGPRGNGALTADGWISASYNSLNQPISIWSQSNQGDVYTHFEFDPLGRCVKRWVGPGNRSATNGATFLYYDGWNLIQEGPSAGIASKLYIHGARVDEIVKQITPSSGAERFFHYDARTHCTLQTDASANIVEQYSYNAFGTPHFYNAAGTEISYSQSTGNRFLFTGREWLNDLKIYDYRNRLYQPELGRFLQPDPKHFAAGDYNLYRYCHNDPVNKSDPFGMDPVFVSADEAALAFKADVKDILAYRETTVLGIFRTYEYSTSVYRDPQGHLSLSDTKTDEMPRTVKPLEDARMTSVVETHNHIHNGDNEITKSKLSDQDVTRGNQTGRTQEVITPDGTVDRYRPSDNSNERGVGTGGIIERRQSDGSFHRLSGANTNLKNRLDARNGY